MSEKRISPVVIWRKRTKLRMIDAFGGACVICGYNKYHHALEFHHLNPGNKEFPISIALARPRRWDLIVIELRKCICVCKNCHAEIENGITEVPPDVQRFNEDYAEYRKPLVVEYEPCPMCAKEKPITLIYCSRSCAAKSSRKVDWDNINLARLLNVHNGNMEAVGRKLHVTGAAVRKRKIKLGLS